MTTKTNQTTPVLAIPAARAITAAGAALTLASTFLAWTWTAEFPGDLTVTGYPGGLQVLTLVGAAITLLFTLSGFGIKGLGWLTPGGTNSPVRLAALGVLGTMGFTFAAIAIELGGIVNLEPGAWIGLVGAIITVAASLGLPHDQDITDTTTPTPLERFLNSLRAPAPGRPKELPSWAEILIIVAAFGIGLYVVTYGIDTEYPELFVGYMIISGFAVTALFKAGGLMARLSALTTKYRTIAVAAAFVAAAAFPFTQTTDQFTLIAVNILIFATVALGLNIVVGLAGLLDLGYVAFLGVGAYTAALVSGTTASAFGVQFPFWASVLTGAAVSLIFGVVIGAPTLRLRGDYLAIVTLGFGEIFRIAVGNLDGVSGPQITNGPNGVPNIPDLNFFGYNFGESHTVLGFELGSYANYYLLMLLAMILVVLVFSRAGSSRIGRAWVAIREDETAATAMGINGFRVKLIAFALGATLAGIAGTVQAHVQSTVVPEMYVFAGPVPPNSAFLLAAVILGGMGTISGPLIGATLLYMIPAKLQFLQDYQLLGFGLALILLMRFRPEGLIANRRAKLEYHETGQLDVPDETLTGTTSGTTKAGA
ncbi:branched-chain amino acid ABC transporter permease [Streptomyces sp. MW-W600-10]|uniref:branched-chain amino acid ABC transporter permease n=1 Tax=Streptomyces sp. MW-W600-10 TaxID=2829819 RepID=UPI001C457531|nr:branched-chain amino acid ABC transporter permease [Streptomyces sp. MW-W600-10]MBV7248956.1 branched-chain amino acid ABC transporter permease [Streptomyces sp. MW-W600-10]